MTLSFGYCGTGRFGRCGHADMGHRSGCSTGSVAGIRRWCRDGSFRRGLRLRVGVVAHPIGKVRGRRTVTPCHVGVVRVTRGCGRALYEVRA